MSTDQLSAGHLVELRALFDEAWSEDGFDEHDWAHALGGTHFVIEAGGSVRSHVSVVERELVADGRPLRTGYVEAVATRAADRRRGHATRLMQEATAFIDERYQLGALGTNLFDFYTRLGWEAWRGPTSVRTVDGLVPTSHEDGFVMVRRTPSTPELDLGGPISCDWRPGDVW
ncbi:MAG: GNAT family N-acetyltransferase [Actinomycetota bacterium]|nr:GNAT family N-acetyltransferase [Actinomycetota bacterium]MDH5313905.1 GNAT family N-acetyltransferase [Actinomycetota bacterium]